MRQLIILGALAVLLGSCNSDNDVLKFKPDPESVYFEVGEINPVHGDSYLIALNKQEDIDAARNIITTGESKILIAEISRVTNKAEQYNIDLNNNREWSWYVSDFIEFTDFSIEILDGWPGYVEENFDEWVQVTKGDNGKGRIGFWSYTIKREVTHGELTGGN
jgi:hypothetical protein